MDAKEYIITTARMCDTIHNCFHCPFKDDYICPLKMEQYDEKHPEVIEKYADLVVRKVEQWGKDNPIPHKVKRQDRVLKRFPNAPVDKNGVLESCSDYSCYGFSSPLCKEYNRDCDACRKAYWLEEVEE